ncbi:MAG TPA: heavy metal translocating P-type ATPase [Steroidobacteraceae bacterium]|nr:heavy metal translocating P-type ATPase [Steroidobacteraceae bacterium]
MSVANSACFHCGEPIPPGVTYSVRVRDRDEPVCCAGCRAVAELIAGIGLEDFYRFRTGPSPTPGSSSADAAVWESYDRPELLDQLTCLEAQERRSASFVLEGLQCAACAWLVERVLGREAAVERVSVNCATARVHIAWDPARIALSSLLARMAALGYRPHPVTVESIRDVAREERRLTLKRLFVAGLGMMQVMMCAYALYAGDFYGIETHLRQYLRIVSLLVSTPVMFYAGWPFLANAWRALRRRAVVMDVPVAIALVLAYGASVWNTYRGSGQVYFDSVTMFIFFLTLARSVEMFARHHTGGATDALARMMPFVAHRASSGGVVGERAPQDVPVTALVPGDELVVHPGEAVPADAAIIAGSARIDEALLTGESLPVRRGPGDRLLAGSLNLDVPLRARVTAVGSATVLSGIIALLERAQATKPRMVTQADRLAAWFLKRILLTTALVCGIWLVVEPGRAFDATLAVLVVTCPCALSLAMPAAIAATTAAMARLGILVTRGDAIESLARITHAVFDKTGTLTTGRMAVLECRTVGANDEPRCRAIAASLERAAEHPIARAFAAGPANLAPAQDIRMIPAAGIEGEVGGRRYRIGRPGFVAGLREQKAQSHSGADERSEISLGDQREELAVFRLHDDLRPEVPETIRALKRRGIQCEILSGDGLVAVAQAARACGIDIMHARQSPADKLTRIRTLERKGAIIAMVGDGINDAPVLRGAAVSIAMGDRSPLACATADLILIGESLAPLPAAIDVAKRMRQVGRQNLVWAAGYNLVALPLAAFGFVPPWLAAIGMSLSSMFVVANALRLAPRRAPARRTRAIALTEASDSGARAV